MTSEVRCIAANIAKLPGLLGRQALSHVYYETESGRRTAANLLTRDEARCIVMNMAVLLGAAPKQGRNPLKHRRP